MVSEGVHREHLPKIFVKFCYGKCHAIIDCAEVVLEKQKSLSAQTATWLDCKYHNTIKLLVGITPTGSISFLSPCYGVRASAKFITKDSGFYEQEKDMMK